MRGMKARGTRGAGGLSAWPRTMSVFHCSNASFDCFNTGDSGALRSKPMVAGAAHCGAAVGKLSWDGELSLHERLGDFKLITHAPRRCSAAAGQTARQLPCTRPPALPTSRWPTRLCQTKFNELSKLATTPPRMHARLSPPSTGCFRATLAQVMASRSSDGSTGEIPGSGDRKGAGKDRAAPDSDGTVTAPADTQRAHTPRPTVTSPAPTRPTSSRGGAPTPSGSGMKGIIDDVGSSVVAFLDNRTGITDVHFEQRAGVSPRRFDVWESVRACLA